jgi:hypothetical protein
VSLSDEVLESRERRVRIRKVLSRLLTDLDARSAFLIDEAGVPFAAVGNVEFKFPHPLPDPTGDESDDVILKALLGLGRTDESSSSLLFKASSRALLVTVLERPLEGKKHREAMSRIEQAGDELRPMLVHPTASTH